MQNTNNKVNFNSVLLAISFYFSFCLAYWYETRGLIAGLTKWPFFSNEIVAALVGGALPFLVFELAIFLYLQPLQALKIDTKKLFFRLRMYFIFANIICFAISFIYFVFPFLSVWGNILKNFLVYSITLVIYFFNEFKKAEDKTKAVFFIHRIGIVFLMFYGIISMIKIFLELL